MTDAVIPFRGAGGGQKQPTRTDDNLFSRDVVEIVFALGEGPIRGPVDGMKSIYVGGTPAMSQDGSTNFDSFNVGIMRGHAGDPPVNYRLGGETSNTSVGVRLFQNTWVSRTTDDSLRNKVDQLQARILFNTLYKSNDDGTFNNTASFELQYRQSTNPNWSAVNGGTINVTGKTTAGYVVDYVWDVPRVNDTWVIRVKKNNPDSSNTDFCDFSWESFQEVTKGNRTYDRVALMHIVALATSQFSSVPDIGIDLDGLEILVPTNYNPDAHATAGTWDGSFKQAWTNNPAWILYDLIMNTSYGLRKYYPWLTCNRFDFYDAAAWCDAPVPNGVGGSQPRYTFSMVVKDQQSGLDMLQYVAGSFGACIFDDATGTVHLRVDKWEEPSMLFTPENVTPEGFAYTFSDMSTRYNDIEVKFVNPDLDWQQDIRPARNQDHINLNGSIPLSFDAIGCTNEHEALRRAYYRLVTATTEVATVQFTTTRLGVLLDPFKPIYVADPVTGWAESGRIKSIINGKINLRDPIYFTSNQNYTLKLQTTTGISTFTVNPGMIGSVYALNIVSGIVPANVPDRSVFSLEDTGGFGLSKPFRVISVEPADNSPNAYSVTAVEMNINKQWAADNCIPIGSVPYSFKNPLIPPPPSNLVCESGTDMLLLGQDGSIMARIFAHWDPPGSALVDRYIIRWKESLQNTWFETNSTGESVILAPCKTGTTYDIVIEAVSAFGYRSSQLQLWNYKCVGKDQPPSNVKNFRFTRRALDILLTWDAIPDLDRFGYELRLGSTWDTAKVLVTDYAATQFAWTTDTGGSYNFLIRAKDTSGNLSLQATICSALLTGPSPVGGVIAIQSGNRVDLRWDPNPEDNILDYEIREGSTWATGIFLAKVKSTSYSVTAGSSGTRLFWLKAIASPGIYSDKATFVTTDIAKSDNTNIIYTTDEVVNQFAGTKYNMVTYGPAQLRMDDGKAKSEYMFSVALADVFKAQNSLFIGLDAIVDDKTTWAQSTYPWKDPQANKGWTTPGDVASIKYSIQISMSTGNPTGVLYQWRMDNTLTYAGVGEDGSVTESQTVTYKPSKYGAGLYCQVAPLQPLPTKVTFSTNVPNIFSTTFWILPDDLTDKVFMTVVGRDGKFIKLGYTAATLSLYAIDNDGTKVSMPIGLAVGERFLVGLSQDTNDRRIYFAKESGAWYRASIAKGGIGAGVQVKLY
jgi:predicted phage tail protein